MSFGGVCVGQIQVNNDNDQLTLWSGTSLPANARRTCRVINPRVLISHEPGVRAVDVLAKDAGELS